MKNKNKLARFFATLRMTSKRTAFTLTEVAEPRQHGSKHELSAMAKVEPEARQYAPSPLDGEGWGEGFRKRAAFTLAEVLITLGIIGVVVAIIIPALMKVYHHKVLEVKFKKSIAQIQQVILQTKYDLSLESFTKFCLAYNVNDGYYNARTCYDELIEHFKFVSLPIKWNSGTVSYQVKRSIDDIMTYNGNPAAALGNNTTMLYNYVLQDGSYIAWSTTGNQFTFFIDTNGDAKPNKLGHDIFALSVSKANDRITGFANNATPNKASDEQADDYYVTLVADNNPYANYHYSQYGYPCNLDSKRTGNGFSCSYYALKNTCPYDSTKTYWECLP